MSDDNSNDVKKSTMEAALAFVERPAKDYSDYKRKDLGLQLTLFALAEQQAKRINSLSEIVIDLEKLVFDPASIRELDPNRMFALYKAATESLKEAYAYVQGTVKGMDWAGVELTLSQVGDESRKGSSASDGDLTAIAAQILAQIDASKKNKS